MAFILAEAEFQLTAARRRLRRRGLFGRLHRRFNSQPPEGGCDHHYTRKTCPDSFNSQPPEGGCLRYSISRRSISRFQLTAARRRLHVADDIMLQQFGVSTHSRPKAAAECLGNSECCF